jgi:Integrase core domain
MVFRLARNTPRRSPRCPRPTPNSLSWPTLTCGGGGPNQDGRRKTSREGGPSGSRPHGSPRHGRIADTVLGGSSPNRAPRTDRRRPGVDRVRAQGLCEFSKAGTAHIDPGSPWQNPFVESFHSRVRDELLNVEEFNCLAEAKIVIPDWSEDYNNRRPHSALPIRAPAAFATAWGIADLPAPA